MTENNPKFLNFKKLKPIGYPSEYRQTRFTPTSAIQTYSQNDIVRFLIQSDGVWDPRGVFLQIEVEYNDSTQLGVALQLDNSAHSLINQLIVTTNGQEIERIEEYDTIAAMLYDANSPEDLKGIRIHEGVTPGNKDNQRLGTSMYSTTDVTRDRLRHPGFIPAYSTKVSQAKQFLNNSNQEMDNATTVQVMGATLKAGYIVPASSPAFQNYSSYGSKLYMPWDGYYLVPSIIPSTYCTTAATWSANTTEASRYAIHKVIALISQQFPNVDSSAINPFDTIVGNQTEILAGNAKMSGNLVYNTGSTASESTVSDKLNKIYRRGEIQQIIAHWIMDVQGSNSKAIDQDFVDNYAMYSLQDYYLPKYMGYQACFSASLCGNFEQILSSVLPQGWLSNGKFQKNPVVYKKKTFTIPLLSCIFGILLPQENYKYIPLSLFQNLLFEFRLNPYAFFTSGPVQGSFNSTITAQTARSYQINRFEIWADIYYFDQTVMASINSQAANEGLYIQTSSWILGPQFPIANTSALKGTWQVNMGFESLRMLAIIFLLNDYSTYSFCRKQFRVSHNVTQLQLKFGTKYYPPQPIQGHAGNYMGYLNNSQFYQQFQKCFGKLNNIYGESQINPINYCVTDRPYDPTKTTPFYTIGSYSYSDSSSQPSIIGTGTYDNIDTAYAQPFFHENRVVGKCIYAVNLETFPNDDSVISGTNTLASRPFEVYFNCDDANGISRASNMYVFCYADIIYKITNNGIQVLGK